MSDKKNILFISHREVSDCSDGGMISTFYASKYFAQKSNAFFAFLCEKIDETLLQKYRNANLDPVPYEADTKDNFFKYPLSLFSGLSFKFCKFYHKKFLENLSSVIEKNNIEIVWCFAAQTAKYGIELKKRYPDLKIYLREENIEYKLVKQYAKSQTNILLKIISYFEYLKTKCFEVSSWKNFDKIFFISDTDLKIAQSNFKNFGNLKLVYSGTDINNFNYAEINPEENSFLFSGNLKTFQNKQNLTYFIDKIWKYFIKKVPDAKLYITGNTTEYLLSKLNLTENDLNCLNIVNLGFVDNIYEIIKSKKYFISPTLYGSGFRIKVLEGMALGKIVFVTDIDYSMSNLFKDMINIVHFSNFDDFYKKYTELTNNNNLQNSIMINASKLIKENFTWDKYVESADIL